jgi:predicted transcriptional regulator
MSAQTAEHQHVNARVDPELLRLLDEKAEANDRSRSAELRVALRAHVERDEKEEAEA